MFCVVCGEASDSGPFCSAECARASADYHYQKVLQMDGARDAAGLKVHRPLAPKNSEQKKPPGNDPLTLPVYTS